ncbi:flagellar hook-length control protein FliK [Belnapia sp. T6]|uniref:Flagellar hook-length control protein FliK n=1 Tax=Belnapia mucosa TaxID=2804532 RepID=A0ABS1UXG7_9PROT|nr:flagellar hook-length control protein FliK [Belnapia mucosa]MBL6454017.1 flagellar hook-length control protein FliK [Belnapia mucosa]
MAEPTALAPPEASDATLAPPASAHVSAAPVPAPMPAAAVPPDSMAPGLSPPPPVPAAEPATPAAPFASTPPPLPPARQVAQATITLALGNGQAPRLTVALEPEALGRVEIRIERGAEGEPASVRVLAERPETLALLQRDQRELDRSLSLAGISVPEGGLQFGLATGGGEGGGRQAQGWSGGRGPAAPPEPSPAPLLALSLLDIAV